MVIVWKSSFVNKVGVTRLLSSVAIRDRMVRYVLVGKLPILVDERLFSLIILNLKVHVDVLWDANQYFLIVLAFLLLLLQGISRTTYVCKKRESYRRLHTVCITLQNLLLLRNRCV